MRVHMCTLPSCSIIHQFGTAGNRQRFMACDCAMSGFISTIERKLTTTTKGPFLRVFDQHENSSERAKGRIQRNEREEGRKRDSSGRGGCVGFIKGSWRPPGVSHLHPLIHRTLSASASPINMEPLQENESLLI